MDADLSFRPAAAADAPAASAILNTALTDLWVKWGRPPLEGPDDDAAPVLAHVWRTDPGGSWIAADGDRPVAIGASWVRDGLWFLAAMFVLPEWQGRGVGQRLLELAKEDHPKSGEVAALTSNANNPASNRLYSRHGIYPQYPLLTMTGSPAAVRPDRRLGALDVEPLGPSHLDELREIDAAVTGVDRSVDHAWLLGEAAHDGWLFRRRGRPVGYAYLGGDGTRTQSSAAAWPSSPHGAPRR